MKIKVLKLGERATEVDVPAGATVASTIEAAGFSGSAHTRTLNGQIVFDSTPVKEGDVVTLAPKVEGGC